MQISSAVSVNLRVNTKFRDFSSHSLRCKINLKCNKLFMIDNIENQCQRNRCRSWSCVALRLRLYQKDSVLYVDRR
jgi:hypothetical protein